MKEKEEVVLESFTEKIFLPEKEEKCLQKSLPLFPEMDRGWEKSGFCGHLGEEGSQVECSKSER